MLLNALGCGDHLLAGESGLMAAWRGNKLETFALEEAVKVLRPLDLTLLHLSDVMD